MTKYYTFTGVDTSGDAVIYVKHGGDTVSREQMEGIATALGDRLNGLDPLTLFVKELAKGEWGRDSMIAWAKEVLRDE